MAKISISRIKQKQDKQPSLLKLDKDSIPVILWNLFPVTGVLFFGWKPESVFVCYALETVVVGIFNAMSMWAVHYYSRYTKDGEGASGRAMIPLFLVTYYAFVFGQLKIFFFGYDEDLFQILSSILRQPTYNLALGAFFLNSMYNFINGFILSGEYTRRSMGQQMFEPFPRIVIQQVAIILGGFIFTITGNGYPVLIVFVPLKIWLDLTMLRFDAGGGLFKSETDEEQKSQAI